MSSSAELLSKTRLIVLPTLMPLVIINFVGAVVAAFQASLNILIMTAGSGHGDGVDSWIPPHWLCAYST